MILTEADWVSEGRRLFNEVHNIDCLVMGPEWDAFYLELLRLEVGLVAGEGLADTLAMAPPLSGDGEGEQEEPLNWCDDFEPFFFFFSLGDLKRDIYKSRIVFG